jgi:RNA-splicing ligase RtcB
MPYNEIKNIISSEIMTALDSVTPDSAEKFMDAVLKARRIFCAGAGNVVRSTISSGWDINTALIFGSMTNSYLLAGTEKAMEETFGSTCHGAGRVLSRSKAIHQFSSRSIIDELGKKGIHVKAASPKVVAEEAPEAYKDIDEVIRVAEGVGISRRIARMVPIAVVKG